MIWDEIKQIIIFKSKKWAKIGTIRPTIILRANQEFD